MKICKLAPSEHKRGRWLVHLEDGSLLRVGEREVASFGLYTEMELTEQTLEALRQAAAAGEAMSHALRLISMRPLSRRELVQKLSLTSEPQHAQAAADRLEELGYINDEAYARMVAERYTGKGYGERRLREELYRRGVPREYWDEALAAAAAPEEAIDRFLKKKLAGQTLDDKARKRAADALARRGYRWDDIKAGLRRFGADVTEE